MQKWHININRILKVASCSVVICTLLLASVTLPAMAAPTKILYPSDYLSSYNERVDGSALCTFRFKTTQGGYYQFYNGDQYTSVSYGDFSFAPDYNNYDYYQLSWCPLSNSITRPEASGIVISLSDFKTGMYFNFGTAIQLQVTFSTGGSSTYTYQTKASATLSWYDANYQFIEATTTPVVTRSWSYADPAVSDKWVIQSSFDLQIPENAEYLVPRIIVRIDDNGAGAITSISSTSNEYFDITCTKDAVRGNSATMKAIESKLVEVNDQLGDLNDKTDQIINGTDKQQEHAQDVYDEVQNESDTLDDQLGQLEDLEDFDTATVFGTINDFLEADGWKDIRILLEPLLDWTHVSTVMLFVFAFSTMRFLFLGR